MLSAYFRFLFFITKISPIKATKNDTANTTMPGMIPRRASSQLVRPSVANGRATEMPVTSSPSKTPKIPNVKTNFQSISFTPSAAIVCNRNADA
jgi:hypothetical protein